MIDLHSHILPRIDDGPVSDSDSLEMARQAAADGATAVACTAHRTARTPTSPERVAEGIAALQPLIDAAGIPLRLLPGLELDIHEAGTMDEQELRAASLGGSGRWLLIELPFQGWPLDLPHLLTALEVRGFRVLIAHPERAQSVQAAPDRLRDVAGRGALFQLNAPSLTGENGARAERAAVQLLRAGYAHVIASDSHSPTWRAPGLSDALAAAARILRTAPEELRWMVEDVPRAIVEGHDVRPPRLAAGGSATRRTPPRGGRPGSGASRQPTRR